MPIYQITVNGQARSVAAVEDMPMLWVLRDLLGLPGTKFGCGIGMCGACTIHLDGAPVRACQLPVGKVGKKAIVTIEGLDPQGEHPVQKAWCSEDVAQCGYCQAGQIMSACALLKATSKPTDAQIDAALSGNLCRCCTYTRIRRAVKRAAGLPLPETAAGKGS